jgi:hypothetical protein
VRHDVSLTAVISRGWNKNEMEGGLTAAACAVYTARREKKESGKMIVRGMIKRARQRHTRGRKEKRVKNNTKKVGWKEGGASSALS